MSYFMRFMLTDGKPPTLVELASALKAADGAFSLVQDSADSEAGDLYCGDELYAEIEINQRGDPLCDEDIEDFVEELTKHDDPKRLIALDVLERATGMVVLHMLRAGHENPMVLNALWDWLFAAHAGLLQVDEEGFFDHDQRIVSLL
jgi:hypothetical protein